MFCRKHNQQVKIKATANDGGSIYYTCGCIDDKPARDYWTKRSQEEAKLRQQEQNQIKPYNSPESYFVFQNPGQYPQISHQNPKIEIYERQNFIPSASFTGSRRNYYFTRGPQGLGYYFDLKYDNKGTDA